MSVAVLVAAAGYGKTTALEAAAAALEDSVVLRPAAALGLAAGTGKRADVPRPFLVDDVDTLTTGEQLTLAGVVAALPATVRVTLATRSGLPQVVRQAFGRPVLVRPAATLALPPEGTAAVLREEHGLDDADLAEAVHAATAGWTALVHLAAADAAGSSQNPARPEGPCVTWLRDQVLASLTPQQHEVLALAVHVGVINAQLCRHLGADDAVLAGLCESGLLVRTTQPWPGGDHPHHVPETRWRPVPLVAAATARGEQSPAVLRRAAQWFAGGPGGDQLRAAALWRRAGDDDACAATILHRGEEILAAGGAAGVVQLLEPFVGAPARVPALADPVAAQCFRLLLGDAQRMTGDALGALHTLAPLVSAASRDRQGWPPELARRVALVHYMRGDLRAALDTCRRAAVSAAAGPEAVLLRVTEVVCLHAVGQEAAAVACLPEVLEAAEDGGDGAALATAHLAAAIGATGARRDAHLRRALDAAGRAGDVVLQTRVLVNQSDAALGQARYADAAALALQAVHAAQEAAAPPGLRAVAHANVCSALHRLGRFDEARLHGERSVRECRRHGLDRTALGLLELGALAAAQGRREQARLLLEEAADLARGAGQAHVLLPVLAWLTRLIASGGARGAGDREDTAQALALAAEARECAPSELLVFAFLAAGWAALAAGDRGAAQEAAERAVVQARGAHRMPALAEALELKAVAGRDVETARAALHEAHVLWKQSSAVIEADRLLVLLAELPGSPSGDRAAARAASRRLTLAGVAVTANALAGSRAGGGQDLAVGGLLHIRVLGGFDVRAAGAPVPLAAWRSRQARVLVKILVARRGRPLARAQLCELLWADDDPSRTAHRLSVLLSTVRGVLDPGKAWPADHFVRADLLGLALESAHVRVDAEELLRDAAHAQEVLAAGDDAGARELFAEVDRLYRGDAFDEEPYEDWAIGLREEVRAARLRSLRRHAQLCHAAGDSDDAVADLLKLLDADPYDESAHRNLVRVLTSAGRHGEARRALERWRHAMATIGAPLPEETLRRRPAVVTPF